MVDFIKYGTPWCLGICGLAIAIIAMFAPIEGQDRISAFGVANAAIAGAAGLARPSDKGDVVRKADNVEIDIHE